MSRQKKVFAILVILVLLCTWVFPACADPEALPEENEEIVAGDVLSDTDDPEETLIAASGEETEEEKDGEILPAVVSDGEKEEKEEEEQPNLVTEEEQEAEEEKKEEKEEELPGESGENIDLEEGFPEPVDSSDKSEPSEEQYQPEEKDDQEKEDDDIEFDPEEGDGKSAEDGQEDEQKDGQDETVSTKLEEKQEEPAPAMAMLSLSKHGDIAEDQQKKTEEPPTEEPALRNTKGNTGYYTVAVQSAKNMSDYQVLASVGEVSYIGTIQSTGAVYFGADLQLPGKPESLAIVSKNNHNETLHEIIINNQSYFIYDPILDEEKHECTIQVVQQTRCQIIFSSVPGTDMKGRYYIVVKRKGYGTPVAWAQIENGKMGSVQSRNNNAIYNDSTFVIIKTDDFDIDRYSSYPEKILQSGGQFSNSIIFTWNSTPIPENKTYFYYINAAQINGLETEEHTEYGTITISTKGSDEQELSETTFALYEEEACKKAIRTFTGGSITVRTKEDLGDYLPTETGADHARTLYLKQTEVQTGYDIDENVHPVRITKTITEQLDETENKKTITTSYGITIDETNAANIVNKKRTGPDEREDGKIDIAVVDQDGASLTGSTIILYSDKLYTEENLIATYTEQSFEISTEGTTLGSYLPTETGVDHARTLYLIETEAPAGYDKDKTVHTVVITKSIDVFLDDETNKFITKTKYEIKIDGANAVNFINEKRTGPDEREDGKIDIAVVDQDGAPLTGSTIILYSDQLCSEENQVATYTEQSFEISTEGTTLGSYLPTETGSNHARTLYLIETEAPAGYEKDNTVHIVVITKSIDVFLDDETNKFITKTKYEIKIDGANAANIVNEKRIGPDEREDGKIDIAVVDQDGAPLTGSTIILYSDQLCTEENLIATYTAQSFEISTEGITLGSYLPTETGSNHARTLYLIETEAPAGYEKDTTVHTVVITKSMDVFVEGVTNKFITTTKYEIKIDEANAANIVNEKRIGPDECEDGKIDIAVVDQDGAPLTGSTIILYSDKLRTEENLIATYTAQNFEISTEGPTLESYLPTETGVDHARTLCLMETEAPAGYEKDNTVHTVVITKSIYVFLDDETNKFITKTKYEIKIDEANAANIVNEKRIGPDEREDGKIGIAVVDQAGAPLTGSTIILYSDKLCTEEKLIATYTAQNFEISTGSGVPASYLPTGVNDATTLYLWQTGILPGYKIDTTVYPVVITKSVTENLNTDTNKFITTTTYGITIDGKNSVIIKNTRNTDTKREDGSIAIANKDSDGAALCGSTFKLYTNQECTEESELLAYTDQSFVISTSDEALKNSLPVATGVENATTLYLKQETVPTEYDIDPELHSVVITKDEETTYLDTEINTYITKTVYGITIDDESEIVITNKRHSVTNGEGNHSTPEGENNPIGEGNGDSTNTEGNGNTTTGEESNGTTTGGNGNNPTGEGNGGSTIIKENGNDTISSDNDGTNTGDNGKTVTSGEMVNNATGGKDENSKNSSENGDETAVGSSGSVTEQERNNDNPNSQSNQDEKAPGTTAINTNSGSITTGNDEATKQTEQRTTTNANDGTDTKPLTTKTGPWIQKPKTNRAKLSDGQNEDIIIYGIEIEQVISFIQETIRIITWIGKLLSVLARYNILAFLK